MGTPAPAPRYGTVESVRALLDRDVAADPQQGGGHAPDPDADVAAAFGDTNDTAASLPGEVIAERLRAAGDQVDSVLAACYAAVPFPDGAVPDIVVTLTEAIAAYLATLTHLQSEQLEKDDPVRLRYDWAVGHLDRIARGDAGIPGHARAVAVAAGHGAVLAPRNPYGGRMFSADTFGLSGGGGPDRGGWDVR